jgi:hypothetical protein
VEKSESQAGGLNGRLFRVDSTTEAGCPVLSSEEHAGITSNSDVLISAAGILIGVECVRSHDAELNVLEAMMRVVCLHKP